MIDLLKLVFYPIKWVCVCVCYGVISFNRWKIYIEADVGELHIRRPDIVTFHHSRRHKR